LPSTMIVTSVSFASRKYCTIRAGCAWPPVSSSGAREVLSDASVDSSRLQDPAGRVLWRLHNAGGRARVGSRDRRVVAAGRVAHSTTRNDQCSGMHSQAQAMIFVVRMSYLGGAAHGWKLLTSVDDIAAKHGP